MTRMNDEVQQALARGVDWLVAQQLADGGWHSTTYGQLKDGAAVTALALYALAHLPLTLRSNERVWSKASAFLERGITRRGTIAGPDGTLDFPTYAAALWLSAQGRLSSGEPSTRTQKIVDYLLAAQIAKPRGFEPDSPSFGGWDLLSAEDAQGIPTGTNVSVRAYAVEAVPGHATNAGERIEA